MDKEALSKSRDIGKAVKDEIQQILDEVEKTTVLKLQESPSRNVLNQPERIAVSSTSAITATEITSVLAESGFNSFSVNLPRPAFNVKSIQLLSANIPQAQVNIQDNALVFWYYRLATQKINWNGWSDVENYNIGDKVTFNNGFENLNFKCIQSVTGTPPPEKGNNEFWEEIESYKYENPNIFNLYCVRLLPSYYKKELIGNAESYGYNRTFDSYQDLEIELKKACENPDLALAVASGAAVNDITTYDTPTKQLTGAYMPKLNGDISIQYDTTMNKFTCKGNNVFIPTNIPEWDVDTEYPPQSLVRYTPVGDNERYYYNISEESGTTPVTGGSSWRQYEYDPEDPTLTIWNTYLVAGYNDPNVIALQGTAIKLEWNEYHTFLPNSAGVYYNGNYWFAQYRTQNEPPPEYVWNNTTTYNEFDIVYYQPNNKVYISLQNNNLNADPETQTDWWEEIYSPWVLSDTQGYTGINAVSQQCDFFNRLVAIQPQPYTSTIRGQVLNNQTLNRVLGFTWNGLNMLNPFTLIPTFSQGNLITLFYNRLRPVPSYFYNQDYGLNLLGYTFAPYTESTTIYTADAFCNLVYSSVVNIYTRMLGGSTTDTVRNTNLLAIVPLNCGNLGVTFTNNFIDNPLTKMDTDIYTMEFSFTTETDQPYWFSNNAIITLQLKLGYDEK